ncbi:MAG: hypothetical protein PHF24_06790 [Syntrophomonas sp.]|nr:hypothetical protein [Syntrophomonas sp.]
MIKVEMHDFESLVACFWHTGDQQWEGVVTEDLHNLEVNIIKSDRAVILLRKSDCEERCQVSGQSSR